MSWGTLCPIPDLSRRVVLVTGASRGCGRGIASALGEARATVYVTGRTSAGRGERHPEGLAGTIEETAELVTQRGGVGIAIPCDHREPDQIESLASRVLSDAGRLDVLVNNVWGGYEHHDLATFTAPFWEQPTRHWQGMFECGLRAHLLITALVAPAMVREGRGLIITTTAWDRNLYLGNLYYDTAKHAIGRAVWGMARELRPHGVTSLALAPGWMRTERVLAAHAAYGFDLAPTESVEYSGRGAACLAGDPEVARFAGRTVKSGELAIEYGFTDLDGRLVPPFEIPGGQ
ncbi:MAG: SDR family NAD(P)-dependent oxidoreductase [Phycisphaerales bacterium]|nr:SDR family NAD(P)-dependent oxidoreductase [Phycisphaerales bacterium]